MDDNKLIQNLRTLPLYNAAMKKLTVAPTQLDENEKTFLLTVAIILLRKYEKDNRLTSFVELAYSIILKYSLSFNDFAPLYDFSVNIGYYPIAQAITDFEQIQIDNIASAIIPKEYVHDEFYAIEYIKKGIIYLHGKMPDNVKEYLEYKYSQIPELQFIIANKVILEGINLPISSLFVLNGTNLYGKDLTNLIGRVNRLNLVFSQPPKLGLLMPQVHFVNSEEYNRRRGNFENKIRLLRSSVFADNVKNPTLENFDIENKENKDNVDKCKEIVENESIFFAVAEDPIQELKHYQHTLA